MKNWTTHDLLMLNQRKAVQKAQEATEEAKLPESGSKGYELEKELMREARSYFKSLKDGGRILAYIHMNDSRGEQPDIPDWILLLPFNKVVMIECKSAKGRLSPGQKRFIKRADNMYVEIAVCKTMEEIIGHVKPLLIEFNDRGEL